MKKRIAQGAWSAGVLAGLVAGVLAAASTPTAAFAQDEEVCWQCVCDGSSCLCSMIWCGSIEP